jgi:hypothetical protein
LEAIQKIVQGFSVKYVELHTVRWLSLHKAVQVLYTTLDSLIIFLESQVAQGKDATALGLLRAVKNIRFIYITHILIDILPILTKLSKVFQSDTADLSIMKPCIDTAIIQLGALKCDIGEAEKYFMEHLINCNEINETFSETSTITSEDNDAELVDMKIRRPITYYSVLKERMVDNVSSENLTKIKQSLIQAIIEGLNSRFPEDLLSIISCFEAYNPLCLASLDILECKKRVQNLGIHFNTYLKSDELLKEYDDVHILLTNSYKSRKLHNVANVFLNSYLELYPNTCTIYEIYLVIPISSASVERSFSTQNRIKNKFRNRLSIKNLSNFIRISDENIDAESFDFDEAAKIFKGLKNRKI